MRGRMRLLILTMVVLASSSVALGSAHGRSPGSTNVHEPSLLRVVGEETFEANALIQATFRFSPERAFPHTGEVVRWADQDGAEDPHTITIVRQRDLPTSVPEVFMCEVCNEALGAHFSTDPPTFRVDVGRRGLDRPGDSLLMLPGDTIGAKVSAPAGTTLHYLCAIHGWMQGRLVVGE